MAGFFKRIFGVTSDFGLDTQLLSNKKLQKTNCFYKRHPCKESTTLNIQIRKLEYGNEFGVVVWRATIFCCCCNCISYMGICYLFGKPRRKKNAVQKHQVQDWEYTCSIDVWKGLLHQRFLGLGWCFLHVDLRGNIQFNQLWAFIAQSWNVWARFNTISQC